MEYLPYLVLVAGIVLAALCILPSRKTAIKSAGAFVNFAVTIFWLWKIGAFDDAKYIMSTVAGCLFIWAVVMFTSIVLSSLIALCEDEVQVLKKYFYGKRHL